MSIDGSKDAKRGIADGGSAGDFKWGDQSEGIAPRDQSRMRSTLRRRGERQRVRRSSVVPVLSRRVRLGFPSLGGETQRWTRRWTNTWIHPDRAYVHDVYKKEKGKRRRGGRKSIIFEPGMRLMMVEILNWCSRILWAGKSRLSRS